MRKTVEVAKQSADAARDAVVIAKRNTDAARASVRVMRRNAERELRARVFAVEARRLEGPRPGPVTVEVTIKNVGKMPAYQCTFAVALLLGPAILNQTLPNPQKIGLDPKVVLPPGGEIKIIRKLPEGTFAQQQHELVTTNQYGIYVYGEIEYRNGFKRDRHSTFLMRSSGDDYALGRFSFCEQGNTAN